MARRSKMNRQHSRRVFTNGALRVHPKNNLQDSTAMRGGIRL